MVSTSQMPTVSEEEGDDVVFLSPEESPPGEKDQDQGASPVLRHSNRKRKSVTTVGAAMTKGSGSKKKSSPSRDDPGP